jgi:hypothetical protein
MQVQQIKVSKVPKKKDYESKQITNRCSYDTAINNN